MMNPGWWRAVEALPDGAVMADWALELGNEFEAAQPLLQPTAEQAETYPCMNRFRCECRHRVEPDGRGGWLAVCDCDQGCPPLPVEPKDLLVYASNDGKLSRAIAKALGLSLAANHSMPGSGRSLLLGTYGPLRSSAYLVRARDAGGMAREVERLFMMQRDPFIVVTATGARCSVVVESILKRQACIHIPLLGSLRLETGGCLGIVKPVQPALEEFVRQATEGRGLGQAVLRMDRNLEAVAKRDYALAAENDELRQLKAGGAFEFAVRVGPDDFQAFATIMALGNRKAAAEFLKVPYRSFYDRVDKWSARGRDYLRLVRWIEWRKASSRKIKLRLEDSVQSGEPNDRPENPETISDVLDTISAADNRDYPKILADVMQALKTQNPKNWAAVRDELVDMIKEEVSG
jgi:hypothetical protein